MHGRRRERGVLWAEVKGEEIECGCRESGVLFWKRARERRAMKSGRYVGWTGKYHRRSKGDGNRNTAVLGSIPDYYA